MQDVCRFDIIRVKSGVVPYDDLGFRQRYPLVDITEEKLA